MNKRRFHSRRMRIVLGILITLVLAGLQGPTSGGADEKKFLADRHQAKGMTCASCHKEAPPQAAVPTAVCQGCHGSYAKIAQRTINVEPNPHASHMGELSCESCHHAHKASESLCATCHQFNHKMP